MAATSIVRLSLESNQYEQGLRGAKKQFEDFSASIGINMKKMTAYGLAAGAAASAINGLTSAISEAFTEGTRMAKEMEGVRMAFNRLDQPGLLDNLREATHGTVNDLELMKQAVKFDNFNLSLEQMGTMLAFAQQQAKDTGQDVGYLVDSIVTGLGRKSLPILDNLGLSATEIRERMKETGDMTNAVADIIQERMNAAGGYVETAADRAAQATVELENAMTSLGETFAPLVGASDSLWNSIKIGAINALNTAVKPLIQALAEAGALGQGARSSAGFSNLGGNSKVDRMIGRLGNGKTEGSYSIYQRQLGEFDKYINNKRFQIAAYGGDNSSVAQSAKARLQTELDGALKMRAEYVKRAQELHNQVPSVSSDASDEKSKKKGGKTSNTKAEQTELQLNQKKINDLTNEYVKLGDNATEAAKKRQEEIQKEIQLLIQRNNLLNIRAENAQGKLKGGEVGTEGLVKVDSLLYNDIVPSIDQIRIYLEKNPIKIPVEAAADKIKGIMKTASITADVVGSIGDAFNAIEDPAAKVAGTIAQAIASVALGYATATAQAGTMGPWAWVAFAATGLAEMLTMISTIHSATGYASGGIVSGNSFSGDNVPAMVGNTVVGLNAGELILNKSQQNNIASQLTQAGGGGRLVAKLKGRDILISLERELSETGKGQLATWR